MNIIDEKEAQEALTKAALLVIQLSHGAMVHYENESANDWANRISRTADRLQEDDSTSIREKIFERASIILADESMTAFLKQTLEA